VLTVSGFSAVGLLFTLYIGVKWRASLWPPRRLPSSATPGTVRP